MLWRPALDALRVSLETREVAEVRQQYERLREEHGFATSLSHAAVTSRGWWTISS